MYRNILVPLDGTDFRESALPHAAMIAKKFDSRCHVVRVLPMAPVLQPGIGYLGAIPYHHTTGLLSETELQGHEKAAKENLLRVKRKLNELGIAQCSAVLRRGHYADIILDEADKIKAELIVTTSRQLKGLFKWLAGSSSQTICQEAKCPVLLVQGDRATDPLQEQSIHGDLTNILESHMGSLAEALRCDEDLVRQALPEAVAMLLGGLANQSDTGPQLKEILGQLRFYDGGIDNIDEYLDVGHSGSSLGLVSHIFDSKGTEAASLLSQSVEGLSPKKALEILGFLSPIILSDLSQRVERSSELQKLLNEEIDSSQGETAEWMATAEALSAK